jgi:hypothetical protein
MYVLYVYVCTYLLTCIIFCSHVHTHIIVQVASPFLSSQGRLLGRLALLFGRELDGAEQPFVVL